MILLRSLPEFSTMCIGAVDFLGDAMNCKGSVFSTVYCNESSCCDGRDEEVLESKSTGHRAYEEDFSGRYGDLLDTHSLSSSVHHLLHDSSQRRLRRTTIEPRVSDDNIFRSRRITQETANQPSAFNQLNRCTAWVQDDYSFESERPSTGLTKKSDVRIVHWEDRVIDPDTLNCVHGCSVFRPNKSTFDSNSKCYGILKLQRCTAWSLDESSFDVENDALSSGRKPIEMSNEAKIVHWDELVEGSIK
mmetsp:Transcript_27668/g.60932  ORF Transcript_27668/g.60932 Transcript_27668/m.60932 type:complete len:247 (+) Transcript_27668:318-1058(+)|eukprot:CAMPEP_0168171204 /NCGR_PEP_ID=MMETSP0139_2-20121125/4583_1 /TAXON_ID=44445 /ORGANISM="Pseudo-nitzschia australis, Strain 10249 10 AB" /LENGTH=246 /DNA_ID=CAMNT_0008088747 /DNA_START=128 /DNA_END=868 /DNA_ORIENTATION=+